MASNFLPPEEVARFYKIWFPLLHYVNQQLRLVKSFPANPAPGAFVANDGIKLRDALWANDSLRERFIAENPINLSAKDLALVESWRYRRFGSYVVLRSLSQYTVFLTTEVPMRAYGVLGLGHPIEKVLSFKPPCYVRTALLPYEGQIIYDSLAMSYGIAFSPTIRKGFEDDYHYAQEREGVITSLLPISIEEQQNRIDAGNVKTLAAFRKSLRKAGLNDAKIEQHVENMRHFVQTALAKQIIPRGLLSMTPIDIETYLRLVTEEKVIGSFKQFIHFLTETERMPSDQIDALQKVIKG